MPWSVQLVLPDHVPPPGWDMVGGGTWSQPATFEKSSQDILCFSGVVVKSRKWEILFFRDRRILSIDGRTCPVLLL